MDSLKRHWLLLRKPHWWLGHRQQLLFGVAHPVEHTSGERVVSRIVSSHSMFDCLICHKVECMCWPYTTSLISTPSAEHATSTSAHYNTCYAFPHRSIAFDFPYSPKRLLHTRIDTAFSGLEDLEAGLRRLSTDQSRSTRIDHYLQHVYRIHDRVFL